MNIKPVTHAAKPKYPDKYEIELNRTLLYYRPKRWTGKPVVSLSLAALVTAGTSGCFIPEIFGPGPLMGDPMPPEVINYSDTDALKIIKEELENAGFSFTMPGGNAGGFEFDAHITKDAEIRDLEYVSKNDCENKKYPGLQYSSYCYPDYILRQLRETHSDAALFQNPLPYENPEDALRAQVREFLEWLQTIEQ